MDVFTQKKNISLKKDIRYVEDHQSVCFTFIMNSNGFPTLER